MLNRKNANGTRAALMGTSVLVGLASLAAMAPASAQDAMETVTVTGYRASLTDSTNAKRASVSFSDAVFAEDIGKFPDTNIAESLNRIPGITITRDNTGEGYQVAIRGLGTNFTKVLLNGNPISVASTGPVDAQNTNRQVDLNMFPTELFTQLTVSKSLSADQMEGGAAGIVTMRSMRPFDKPGMHLTYNLQLSDNSMTNMGVGKRGTLLFSDTEGPWGLLVGVTGVQSSTMTKGWEDGNAGWNTANLPGTTAITSATGASTGGTTGGACGTNNVCNNFGGTAWTIQSTVPVGINIPIPSGYALASGYTANVINGVSYFPSAYPVSAGMLYALNPGLAAAGCSATAPTTSCLNNAMTLLSNAMLPRLGRPMFESGTRDRYNAIISGEFRPSDTLHFYADFIFGRTFNNLNRSDADWGVRGGNSSVNMIPVGLTLQQDWLNNPVTAGLGGAVAKGQFYDAVFGLEARPYMEKGDFISLNPGMSWDVTDKFHVDFQMNYTRSHFKRASPTIMVTTCNSTAPAAGIANCPNGAPTGGTILSFDNTNSGTAGYPLQSINLDLNDPGNYTWNLGRVNLQSEKRFTITDGAHLDLSYGDDKFAVKVGAAYDHTYRFIEAVDYSGVWQNAVCGDNPNVYIVAPNTAMPGCTGQSTTTPPVGWTVPPYAGYGTGYTSGWPALAFQGSKIPTSSLKNYLMPGPNGFVTVNYGKFFADSGYWDLYNAAWNTAQCVPHCNMTTPPFNGSSNTNAGTGGFDERTVGLYGKVDGSFDIGERKLKYDIGLRWVQTRQNIITPVNTTDARNATLGDGGKYPNYYVFTPAKGSYQAFLPSVSAVYQIADDFQVRASLSRTMTRPDPSQEVGALIFSDPNVSNASLGNPHLKPFFSNNIDIGAELYTGGEGYVGFTMFRKYISGFTANLTTVRNFAWMAQYGITWNSLGSQQQLNYQNNGGPTGQKCSDDATCAGEPINVSQTVNLPGLEIINGMEIDYVQPFDFLTEPYLGIKGFGFNGNLTLIDQKSTGSVPSVATGIPPVSYNLTAYYEDHGVMLRLSYNWNDKNYGGNANSYECYPAQASGATPKGCPNGPYLISAAYGQADISSSLKLSELFGDLPSDPELTFDVQNVFSAKQKSYIMLPDAPHSYYIKGQTYMVGLRGSF